MRNAFIAAITDAAARDDRVMLLTADLGFKLFDNFAERFPKRFLNMGVCEANMVSVAAGLALEGKRPFTYSIVPFATIRCLEQIRNDVCNMALPVIVIGVGGGYAYGINGPTHHGVDDIAAMRALPGMTVVSPADPVETQQAVAALLDDGGPAYLRLNRAHDPVLDGTAGRFVLGEPKVLREGTEVALLACGAVSAEAMAAAELLAGDGACPLVLSVHTVKPIRGLTKILRDSNVTHAITLEEHGPHGGLYEAVCGHLAESSDPPAVTRLSAPNHFLHRAGSQHALRETAGLHAANIVETVKKIRQEIEC